MRQPAIKLLTWIALAAALCCAEPAAGQTRAGTAITNQAIVTFDVEGISYRLDSNVVTTLVMPKHGLSLVPNGTTAEPGQVIRCRTGLPALVPYVLTNTGNDVDSFVVEPFVVEASSGGPVVVPGRMRIFLDTNANGAVDGQEGVVTRVDGVPPGEARSLLVEVAVPSSAVADAQAHLELVASSSTDSSQRDAGNVSRLLIVEDAIVTAIKSATPESVEGGGTVHFDITGSNIGAFPARLVDVVVDGQTLRGLFVRDPIPGRDAGVAFLRDTVRFAPLTATPVFSTDSQVTWSRGQPAQGASVTDVGLVVPGGLRPDQAYRLGFDVAIPEEAVDGILTNVAVLDYKNVVDGAVQVRTRPTTTPIRARVRPAVVIGPMGDPEAGVPGDPEAIDADFQIQSGVDVSDTIRFTNTLRNTANVPHPVLLTWLNPPQAGSPELRRLPPGTLVIFYQQDGRTPMPLSGSGGFSYAGVIPSSMSLDIVVEIRLPRGVRMTPGEFFDVQILTQSLINPDARNITTDRIQDIRQLQRAELDLAIAVSPEGLVSPGSPLDYMLSFGNASPTTQTRVVVADTLPLELVAPRLFEISEVVSLDDPAVRVPVTVTFNPLSRVLQWAFATLPPNFRGKLRFTATVADTVPENTTIDNRASIVSSERQPALRSSIVTNQVLRPNLELLKEVSRPVVVVGELVSYRLTVTNKNGLLPLANVVVTDDMPRGFRLRGGSVTIDGGAAADPSTSDAGRRLTFALGALPRVAASGAATNVIVYQAIVGADALQGDAVNTAVATATTPAPGSLRISSFTSSVKTRVRQQRFSLRGVIFGRVYHDNDRNGRFGKGDQGARGVKLYLDDGSFVVTDPEGKYHFEGVREGHRMVKVDQRTLPAGAALVPPLRGSRHGDGELYWEKLNPTDLLKMNFRLTPGRSEPSAPAAPPAPVKSATPLDTPSAVAPAFPPPARLDAFDSSWFPAGDVTMVIGKLLRSRDGAKHLLSLAPPVPLALGDSYLLVGPAGETPKATSGAAVGGARLPRPRAIGSGLLFQIGDALTSPAMTIPIVLDDSSSQQPLPVVFGKNRAGRPVLLATPETLPAALHLLQACGYVMRNGIWTRSGPPAQALSGLVPLPPSGALPGSAPSTGTQVRGIPAPVRPAGPAQATTAADVSEVRFLEPPAGAAFSNRDAITVVLEVPGREPPRLTVAETLVGADRIGTKAFDSSTERSRFTFLDVKLVPGANRLRAAWQPAAGPAVLAERTVFFAMKPSRIAVEPLAASFAADGRETAKLRVRVLDPNGVPAIDGTAVTIATEKSGLVLGSDADPGADGFQVRTRGGEAIVELAPAAHSEERLVEASLGDVIGRGRAVFSARPMDEFTLVRGDLTLGLNEVTGRRSSFPRSSAGKDDFAEGDLSVYLRRRVLDDKLLTFGYMSNRDRERGKLFRSFDLDAFFPTYGDSSTQDFDAESRSDVYLRLEQDLSYVLWGDYRTQLSANELTGYDRTLTGAKVNVQEGRFKMRAFASHTDQTLMQDQIPGAGVSGLYFLQGVPIIENSESIYIEVRNRFLPAQVLNRRQLRRFGDYSIDYFLGTLLFTTPVPALDENFNPVYIVAQYETFNAPRKLAVYGGRASYAFGPDVELGLTEVVEEQMMGDRRIGGLDLRVSAWDRIEIKGEAARSDTIASLGDARKLDVKVKLDDRLRFLGAYRNVDPGFQNPSMSGQFRADGINASAFGVDPLRRTAQTFGAMSAALRLEYNPEDTDLVVAERIIRNETLNNLNVVADSVDYSRKFEWGSASIGYVDADGPRETGNQNGEAQFLRAAVKRQLSSRLALVGQRQEVVGGTPVREYPNRTGFGAEYAFSDATRTFLRLEEDDGELLQARRIVSGVETAVDADTNVYSRYQIDGGNAGSRNAAGMGVRTSKRLNDRLGVQFNLERQQTLSGTVSYGLDDFTATGVGFEYIEDLYKIAGRLETRFGQREDNLLATLGGSYRAWDDVNLFIRGREYIVAPEDGTPRRTALDILFGTAFRPSEDDRFNALAKVHLLDGDSTRGFGFGFSSEARRAIIGTVSANYEFTPGLQAGGSFALQKATDDTGATPFTGISYLWSGRLTHDITRNWSGSARYSQIGERASGTELESYGLELDRRLGKNLFLGAGFNFEGFDDRIFPDADRTSEGPYVAVRARY